MSLFKMGREHKGGKILWKPCPGAGVRAASLRELSAGIRGRFVLASIAEIRSNAEDPRARAGFRKYLCSMESKRRLAFHSEKGTGMAMYRNLGQVPRKACSFPETGKPTPLRGCVPSKIIVFSVPIDRGRRGGLFSNRKLVLWK